MGFSQNIGYITDTGGAKLEGICIFEIRVNNNADITSDQIEDGGQRQDSKVRKPIEVTCSCGVDEDHFAGVAAQLEQMFKEKTSKLCTVCTKTHTISNLAVTNYPFSITPDHFDTFYFDLTLKEVIIVGTSEENISIGGASNAENSSNQTSTPTSSATPSASTTSTVGGAAAATN